MLKRVLKNIPNIPIGMSALLLGLCLATSAVAGDWKWEPSISGGAEYNDNVNESNNPKADYVLTVKPGIKAEREGGRLLVRGSYYLNHRHYVQGNKSDESKSDLSLYGLLEAVEDVFFLEVDERYSQVYRSPARGEAPEGESYNDLIDQNSFQFTPYVVFQPGDATSVRAGYRYQHYSYSKDTGIDKNNNNLFAYLKHGINPNWDLDAHYDYQHENPHGAPGLERHKGLVGATWDYAEDSEAYFRFGPAYTNFEDSQRQSTTSLAWDTGLTHSLGASLLKINSSLEFDEDPVEGESIERRFVSVGWEKEFKRTNLELALSYNEYSNTGKGSNTKSWRPKVSGTHSLSERMQMLFGASMDLQSNTGADAKYLYANAGLQYDFSENFSGEAMYRFKNSYTEKSPAGTYKVNRILLSLTAKF